MGPEARAEPLGELGVRAGAEGRKARDTKTLEPGHGLRPDPGDQPGGGLAEALPGLRGGELEEAVRLLGVGRDLRHQLARADPHRAGEPRVAAHRLLDLPGRRPVAVEPGEVEIGLVEPHRLDPLHMAAQDGVHVARALAVEIEVGTDEHRLRTQPPGPLGRGGGEDAVAARLVAGRGDHGARAAAGHHHRQAAQLRSPLELDADVEGIHVQMCVHVGRTFQAHVASVRVGKDGRILTVRPTEAATGRGPRPRRSTGGGAGAAEPDSLRRVARPLDR